MPDTKRRLSETELRPLTDRVARQMEVWRDSRVLVTGASGFFGSWLVQLFHHANRALGLNAQLVGVAAPTEDLACVCPQLLGLDDVQIIRADICHLGEALRAVLPECCDRLDAVIHAAIHVDSRVYDSSPLPTLETAVKGTWEALELARIARARRFLFVSSGAVYGAQPPTTAAMSEDHLCALDPTDPRSAYAEGKRVGETMCAGYLRQHGLAVTIARPFAFVGPYMALDRHFAIGNFLRDALAGRPVVVQSDGRPLRSYLHASDLAVWLWTILTDGALGRPYNVGSSRAVPLGDVARIVAQSASVALPVEVRGTPTVGPPPRYIPSVARAESELGLSETLTLEESVRRTLAWYQGSP